MISTEQEEENGNTRKGPKSTEEAHLMNQIFNFTYAMNALYCSVNALFKFNHSLMSE